MNLLKDWKIPHGIQNVNFELLDKDEKTLSKHANAICFSVITYSAINKDATSIRLWWNKKYTPYSVDKIEEWLKILQSYKIVVNFVKEENDLHYYSLPLYNSDGEAINRFMLVTTLSLLRILYEVNLNHIPANFFELKKLLPNERNFYLIQFAHHLKLEEGYCGNWNHAIKHTDMFTRFLPLKTFVEERKRKVNIFGGDRVNLVSTWNAVEVPIYPQTSLDKAYYIVKKASMEERDGS